MLALIVTAAISFPKAYFPKAYAHEVETAGDVGATMHIEPSDTPKAGEEVLAWFAIARPGGQTIPLANCDCTLAVYAQPSDQPHADKTPELTPAFAAVEAEGYEDIPGARFIFPDVGTYTLVVSGEPKQEGDFSPFELDFETTVASGTPVAQIPEDAAAALPSPDSPAVAAPATEVAFGKWAIVGISLVALIAIAGLFLRRSK